MAARARRQRSQLPTCYYEGYLDKRSFKDKTSRKLWACLCGSTLFFFNEKRETDYVEKMDLSEFISITDDSSQDQNLDAARLNLLMKDGNIKFTAPNAEARELWKGYIHSVAELSLPSSLNLLPGQIHMLREAIEREKDRIKESVPPPIPDADSSSYICLKADMPACYYAVSRMEAELLLEKECKKGNLLLRPGREANNFAVTTRQDLNGAVFKHYRVTRKHEGGFAIDVDVPVPCATLYGVIDYLVEKTEGVLIPLIIEETYEKRIYKENGEKSEQAPSNLVPPSVPPKPGFTLSPKIPTPAPAAAPDEEDCIYLNDTPVEEEPEELFPQPQLEKPAKKKALMPRAISQTLPLKIPPMTPPAPAPRKGSPSSTSSTPSPYTTKITRSQSDLTGQIPLAAMSELKLKLEQKKCLQ